jgi:hexulose-6-phosphate isomerase
MKLGILQGRLSPPVDNKIQEFPFNTWKNEFKQIEQINLNHIEWIITKNSYINNPLFLYDLKKYKISSICCDHIIDENIIKFSYLHQQLADVCSFAIKNNINNISIPLLEDSNMENDNKRKEFIDSILKIKDNFSQLNFIFETELSPEKTLEIVEKNNDFFVTYDTGNVTSYLKEHEKYIKILKNKIMNVHLKDRTFDGKTVLPFTGDTDFKLIFKFLKEINYNSLYTLQIAREKTGFEKKYIKKYKTIFEGLHDKEFI